ncbi:hypothetical protein ACJJTC_006955 [Scirpophaga incertulas]
MATPSSNSVSENMTTPPSAPLYGGNVPPMSMSGNLCVNWKKWYQSFKLFMRASRLDIEDDSRKVAMCLHFMGDKGLEIFNSFQKDEEKVTYKELILLFEDYFVPKQNLTYESFKFFTCKQTETETLEEFACKLQNHSQNCQFGELQDRLVKIMFICNLHSKYAFLQEKLLPKDDLKMDETLKLAVTIIQSRIQASTLQGESTETSTINYIHTKNNNSNRKNVQDVDNFIVSDALP